MFMNAKMFIINLNFCIVFEVIHFTPSFYKTKYKCIDTLFVELTLFWYHHYILQSRAPTKLGAYYTKDHSAIRKVGIGG